MINIFLENLKPDFSNIDKVYTELLLEFNPDNINKTEVMFIDSIDIDNINNYNDKNKVTVTKLFEYLRNKRKTVQWFNLDYFRFYLENKRFFEHFLKEYNHLEFQKLSIKLGVYQDRFCYIYFHLYESQRMEFKSDLIDRVNDLIQKQKATKFKKLLSEFIEKIENKCTLFDTIYLYKTAINSIFFETMIDKFSNDGTVNKHQWNYQIKTEFSRNKDEILNNDNLKNINNIGVFLHYKEELVISIVKLCILCYHFDYKQLAKLTEIQSKIIEIDIIIKSISQLSINIEYLIFNNEFDKVLKFKELIKVQIESIIDYIKHAFFIHIETTPVYKKLNDLKLEFENQSKFDIEKIKLINLNSDKTSTNKPQQNHNKNTDEVKKELHQYFKNIKNFDAFIIELINTFPTEKGKTIKAIINYLIKNEMLLIPDREFKKFVSLLGLKFERNIGTYTSINDAEKNKPFNKEFLSTIEINLNSLKIKYKKNKNNL